jgi:hypothetical protein
MATHDYVIANGTGAAVRSDLNNALAAIVSNNSGSSEPGTTYAYQWWADTNANVLKIRNSANDAWITLRELDGTMLIEDGTNSAPGLAFADDTNTGIYSPAADQIGFVTAGVQRLVIETGEVVFNDPSNDVDFRVESNGNTHMLFVDGGNDTVSIGTSTASNKLRVHQGSDTPNVVIVTGADETSEFIALGVDSGVPAVTAGGVGDTSAQLAFRVSDSGTESEAARIDASGRLFVGTTNVIGGGTNALLQLKHADGAQIILARDDSTLLVNEDIGAIRFYGNDGGSYQECARIAAEADGSHANNDKPTALRFYTTADDASSPTERLRISANGAIGIGTTSNSNKLRIHEGADTPNVVIVTGADESSEFLSLGIDSGVPSVTAGGVSSTSAQLKFRTADNGTEYEAARFDKDGRLLIGTTSALLSSAWQKLQLVHANAGAVIVIGRNDTSVSAGNTLGAIDFVGNDSNGTYQQCAKIAAVADGTHQNDDKSTRLVFSTTEGGDGSSTERMRLTNYGTLRVSTNTSDSEIYATSSKTHGIHNDDGSNAALYLEHSHDSTPFGMVIDFTDAAPDNNSSYFITCQDSSTQRLRVWSDGDLDNHDNSYGSISDVKLKQDIVDAGSQWEDLKDLRVRKFKFKSDVAAYGDEAKTLIGLVAQEAETVSPGLVKNNPDLDEDGNELGTVTKSVRYSVLYMKAIKALQEAMDRIETLEAKVAALEAG